MRDGQKIVGRCLRIQLFRRPRGHIGPDFPLQPLPEPTGELRRQGSMTAMGGEKLGYLTTDVSVELGLDLPIGGAFWA